MKLFKQAFIYQLKYPALITAKTFLVQKIPVATCINEQWGPSIDASYQVSVHLAEGF
jgi:hypothetical protein